MICVSIHHSSFEQIVSILEDPQVRMAEIRLDSCPLTDGQIEELFSGADIPLLATFNAGQASGQAYGQASGQAGIPGDTGWADAEHLLGVAIRSGAAYADLPLDAPVEVSKGIRNVCRECGTLLVRSWHSWEGTPDIEYLRQLRDRCFRYGADVAKIVTTASTDKDAETVLKLYETDPEHPLQGELIAFAMGEPGCQSRLECLRRGAPFTYAAYDQQNPAAQGQWDFRQMQEAACPAAYERSGLRMPASKSFAQRAIIAAALAEGKSRLTGYSACDDSESAIRVAQALGATVKRSGAHTLEIEGIAAAKLKLDSVDVGESGLLARLMIPLLSVLNEGQFSVNGRGTLLKRPLSGATDIMASFGVLVRGLNASPADRTDAQIKEPRIPVKVSGPLIAGTAEVPGQWGSQLISGLLTALPLCDKASTMYVDSPKSIPYMFITCDVLRKFGIRIGSEMEGDAPMIESQDWSACTAVNFKIRGGQRYRAADFSLEADWSAAANFMVAGAIFGSVQIEGLDTSSLQADLGIVDILVDAGASVSELENGEICVRQAPLRAFRADLSNAPDLFPIVSVLAAFCAGESSLTGVKRLAGKESDRADAIVHMLEQMGVPVRVEGDGMTIRGEGLPSRYLNGRLLRGGQYSSRGDHRMVMALKVASLGAESPVIIDDEACVGKSFPDFLEMF